MGQTRHRWCESRIRDDWIVAQHRVRFSLIGLAERSELTVPFFSPARPRPPASAHSSSLVIGLSVGGAAGIAVSLSEEAK